MPLFIPARNPRVERSNLVVYNFCNYKWDPFSHVCRGTVIDWSATQLRSKEAYGVWKIEDAYLRGCLWWNISSSLRTSDFCRDSS